MFEYLSRYYHLQRWVHGLSNLGGLIITFYCMNVKKNFHHRENGLKVFCQIGYFYESQFSSQKID